MLFTCLEKIRKPVCQSDQDLLICLEKKKQEKNNNNLDRDCQSDQDLLICLENNEKIQDCQSDQHLKWGMWESSEG